MSPVDALRTTVGGGQLTREESREAFAGALLPGAEPAFLAALLASLATRGETVDEIAGAADALRAAMIPFEHDAPDAIDTAGTGGDLAGTFNISTTVAIVAAAAGARVIKHGNRAASGRCGSADVLQAAGLPLQLSPRAARLVLESTGITFLFAPAYHPALRLAATVRRVLGVRTVFNLLGPLCHPGRIGRQLIGVGDRARLPAVADALARLGVQRALVVHGAGGLDELSLLDGNIVRTVGPQAPRESGLRFEAQALGLTPAPVAALVGGDAADNLRVLAAVLDGATGPTRDVTLLNTSAALLVAGIAVDAQDGVARARAALDSGAARRLFTRWILMARRLEAET